MTIYTAAVTVGTTATLLTGTRVTGGQEQSVEIQVLSGQDIYIGGATVTSSGAGIGRKLTSTSTPFAVTTDEPIYACTASSTASVGVFRTKG